MFKKIFKVTKKITKWFLRFAISKELKKLIKGYILHNKNVLEIAKEAVTEIASAEDIKLTINKVNKENNGVLRSVILHKDQDKINVKFGKNHIVYDTSQKTLETKLNWLVIDNEAG